MGRKRAGEPTGQGEMGRRQGNLALERREGEGKGARSDLEA